MILYSLFLLFVGIWLCHVSIQNIIHNKHMHICFWLEPESHIGDKNHELSLTKHSIIIRMNLYRIWKIYTIKSERLLVWKNQACVDSIKEALLHFQYKDNVIWMALETDIVTMASDAYLSWSVALINLLSVQMIHVPRHSRVNCVQELSTEFDNYKHRLLYAVEDRSYAEAHVVCLCISRNCNSANHFYCILGGLCFDLIKSTYSRLMSVVSVPFRPLRSASWESCRSSQIPLRQTQLDLLGFPFLRPTTVCLPCRQIVRKQIGRTFTSIFGNPIIFPIKKKHHFLYSEPVTHQLRDYGINLRRQALPSLPCNRLLSHSQLLIFLVLFQVFSLL